jgi:hypothetical protein
MTDFQYEQKEIPIKVKKANDKVRGTNENKITYYKINSNLFAYEY